MAQEPIFQFPLLYKVDYGRSYRGLILGLSMAYSDYMESLIKVCEFSDLQEVRCFKRLTDLKVRFTFCGQEDYIDMIRLSLNILLVKQLVFL